MVSRQRQWAIKKQEQGLCPICGKKTGGFFRCRKHRLQSNEAKKRLRKQSRINSNKKGI